MIVMLMLGMHTDDGFDDAHDEEHDDDEDDERS